MSTFVIGSPVATILLALLARYTFNVIFSASATWVALATSLVM